MQVSSFTHSKAEQSLQKEEKYLGTIFTGRKQWQQIKSSNMGANPHQI